MDLLKTEYKIEVWQDIWNGQYWTEKKVATIGANDMEFDGKAYNPELKLNISGDVKFSFEIPTNYFDPITGQYEKNYLLDYLFNEAKIKLYCPQYSTFENDGVTPINNGWYDFIVKEVNENREDIISFSYTCYYLPIVELSRTGQNLVFSLDLENGTGTIDEVEEKILDGTDWTVGVLNADLTEAVEETLFKVVVPAATNISLTGIQTMVGKADDIVVGAGAELYVCYSQITDSSSKIQVIYIPDGEDSFILYNGNVISNKKVYFETTRSTWQSIFLASNYEATKYRGYKIVNSYKILWNNEVGYYVTLFNRPGDEKTYYKYSTTEKKINNVTFNGTTNIVSSLNHGYQNGDLVSFSVINKTTGISIYTNYYVISATTNSFKLSLTPGGAEIDLIEDGSGELVKEIELIVFDHYFYYGKGNRVDFLDNEEDAILISELNPIHQLDSEKIRTLEASDSNRFNLTQQVAELFEVWARYDIYHNIDGSIKIINDKPVKKVVFVDEIGKNNWAGFSYGINMTGLKRNIVSSNIATKMFVPGIENNNLENGTCSIAYVKENISGQEWLINLDYYVQIGLIDNQELIYDLYDIGSSSGLGFLSKLGVYNGNNYPLLIETLTSEKSRIEESWAVAEDAYNASKTVLEELVKAYNNGNCSSATKVRYDTNYNTYKNKNNSDFAILNNLIDADANISIALEDAKTAQADQLIQKNDLEKAFYTKYSRYIQEGTWTGDNYTNDSAYYYDAMNVLLESSRPNIEYTINVIDLSVLEEYEDFNFQIGDITYIEDIEYFGYREADSHGNIIPYREKVIISEINAKLDNPRENKVIVRNYANQFDELFQRITATIQSYSLNENVYEKANNFTANGQLTFEALQSSLINNSLILAQSNNEDVIIDSNGISLTDLSDNTGQYRVKIVSGGLFVSMDGGQTWSTGITGRGINTNLLLAGQIDAAQINIIDGTYPCFTWDSDGLTAFSYNPNLLNNNDVAFQDSGDLVIKTLHGYINGNTIIFSEINTTTGIIVDTLYYIINATENNFQLSTTLNGTPIKLTLDGTGYIKTIDYNSYVRFDKEGLHGIKADVEMFSVGWNGFALRTTDGAITITTDEDIQVFNEDGTEIIQMGRIEGTGTELDPYIYGISIKDKTGTDTFKVQDNGDAMFAGTVNVKDLFINGQHALTGNGKISSEFLNVGSVVADTANVLNAWISTLYAEVVNTNFSDYITGTDVNGTIIGNSSLVRNYIYVEDQTLQMISQTLTLTPVDFTIAINGVDNQVYYGNVRGDNAYTFYCIINPLNLATDWTAGKGFETNRIILGQDSNYYYASSDYPSEGYANWASALDSGNLLVTTLEQHKVKVKTVIKSDIKSTYSFELDPSGSGTYIPVINLGIGSGTADNGKGKIYKGISGLYLEYRHSSTGELRQVLLNDDGIYLTPYELESLDFYNNGFSAEYSGDSISYTWTLDGEGKITTLTHDGVTIPVTWHTGDI